MAPYLDQKCDPCAVLAGLQWVTMAERLLGSFIWLRSLWIVAGGRRAKDIYILA